MNARPVLLFDVLDTLVYNPYWVEVPAFFGLTLAELNKLQRWVRLAEIRDRGD